MSAWRRALLAVAALSSSAALAVACSSFSADDGSPGGDAGPADSPATDSDAGSVVPVDPDAGDAAPVRFCAQQPATALLCDDFEANGGSVSSNWKLSMKGGTIAAATVPTRAGYVAKVTASGMNPDVTLTFVFAAASAIAGVVLDFDLLVDTVGYDYMELGWLHTAGAKAAYFGGVAKGGDILGKPFNPHAGPTVKVDGAWHHVRVGLQKSGGSTPSFQQTVLIDGTTVDDSSVDLSDQSYAEVHIGAGSSVIAPGTGVAVLYYDNVLLLSP